ncbi:hypothetical protein BJY01DRAFT_252658 [Aspergillus pseudoustus]|uniref:C2H2-type domain-containing protein n=1 Tax=Aspergillus pseudoustus TaxID=1810923 RepID=A0ABR4J6A0_9EURO
MARPQQTPTYRGIDMTQYPVYQPEWVQDGSASLFENTTISTSSPLNSGPPAAAAPLYFHVPAPNLHSTFQHQAIQLQSTQPHPPSALLNINSGRVPERTMLGPNGLATGPLALGTVAPTPGTRPPAILKCEWHGCTYRGTFSRPGQLRRHVNTKHISPGSFVCPVTECGRSFNRKDNLGAHMQRVHPEN